MKCLPWLLLGNAAHTISGVGVTVPNRNFELVMDEGMNVPSSFCLVSFVLVLLGFLIFDVVIFGSALAFSFLNKVCYALPRFRHETASPFHTEPVERADGSEAFDDDPEEVAALGHHPASAAPPASGSFFNCCHQWIRERPGTDVYPAVDWCGHRLRLGQQLGCHRSLRLCRRSGHQALRDPAQRAVP